MSRFWRLRLSTLAWGFAVSWLFTGSLVTAVPMFTVIAVGNSLLMWFFTRQPDRWEPASRYDRRTV